MSSVLSSMWWESLLPSIQYASDTLGLSENVVQLIMAGIAVMTSIAGTLMWSYRDGLRYKLPPGPTRLPVIGNLHNMGNNPKTYEVFNDLKKKYGDIVTVYLGSKRVVVLNTPELVKEAFMRKGHSTADRPKLRFFEIFSSGDTDIIMANYSPRQKLQRKLGFAALRTFAAGESLENFLENAFNMIAARLYENPEFEGVDTALLLAYNILASMAFGKQYDMDDPFLKKMMDMTKRLDEESEDFGREFVPILNLLPNKAEEMFKEYMRFFRKYLEETYDEHEKAFNSDDLSDFTYHLINARKEAEEDTEERSELKQLGKEHYVMMLSDLFIAGTETTRMTLNWIWHYLAAYPEVQSKAQQEVDDIIGKDGKVTATSRNMMPYIDAVIHEVMRIKAVAPNGLFHETTADIKLGEYDVPKGTMLVGNTWSIHLDERNWKNAEAFLPERWLDEEGKYHFQQNGFLPFSVGRRSCIGESFAKLEIHMLTTMMLQKFNIKPQPGKVVSLETVNGDVVCPVSQTLVAERRN